MEKFRDVLWQSNIEHKSEQFRNDRKVITHEVFKVRCDFRVQARIEGDHETGKIKIVTKNVGGFQVDLFKLMSQEMNEQGVRGVRQVLHRASQQVGGPREALGAEPPHRPAADAAPEDRAAVRDAQGPAEAGGRRAREARPLRLAALLHPGGRLGRPASRRHAGTSPQAQYGRGPHCARVNPVARDVV